MLAISRKAKYYLKIIIIILKKIYTNLLREVHLWPQVPTAANAHPLSASSRFASSITITALFPPSSSMVLPNLVCTISLMRFPIEVDPVKEMSSSLLSLIKASPTVLPLPKQVAKTPGGHLFISRTSAIMRVVAIVIRLVVEAPFHIVRSPQIAAIAKFQPSTAQGKLNAVITPIRPRGFHCSIMKWLGRSEGKICPDIVRDMPHAMSQMSMNS